MFYLDECLIHRIHASVNYNLFFTHNISLTSFANVINEQKPFLPNIRKSSDKALLIHVVFCTFFSKKKGFDLNSAIDWNRDYIYIKYE